MSLPTIQESAEQAFQWAQESWTKELRKPRRKRNQWVKIALDQMMELRMRRNGISTVMWDAETRNERDY